MKRTRQLETWQEELLFATRAMDKVAKPTRKEQKIQARIDKAMDHIAQLGKDQS